MRAGLEAAPIPRDRDKAVSPKVVEVTVGNATIVAARVRPAVNAPHTVAVETTALAQTADAATKPGTVSSAANVPEGVARGHVAEHEVLARAPSTAGTAVARGVAQVSAVRALRVKHGISVREMTIVKALTVLEVTVGTTREIVTTEVPKAVAVVPGVVRGPKGVVAVALGRVRVREKAGVALVGGSMVAVTLARVAATGMVGIKAGVTQYVEMIDARKGTMVRGGGTALPSGPLLTRPRYLTKSIWDSWTAKSGSACAR